MRSKTKKVLGIILVVFGGIPLAYTLWICMMLEVFPVQSTSDISFFVIKIAMLALGIWLIHCSKSGDILTMSAKIIQGLSIENGTSCTLQAIEDSICIESSGNQIASIKLLEIDSIEEDGSKLQIHTNNEDVSFDAIKKGDLKVFVRQVSEKVRLAKNKVIPYSPQQATKQVVEDSKNLCDISNTDHQATVCDDMDESSQQETHEEQSEASSNLNVTNTTIDLMYCYNCGAKLREGSVYCENCGQKL